MIHVETMLYMHLRFLYFMVTNDVDDDGDDHVVSRRRRGEIGTCKYTAPTTIKETERNDVCVCVSVACTK